jgi:hypothetical protein
MPFTPLHMGPGLLVRGGVRGGFSLMVFGWTQIVMDIEPLWAMLSDREILHDWSHTWVGAVAVALVAMVSGKPLGEFGLRLLRLPRFLPITWGAAAAAAFSGAFSHVVLDGLMHFDIQPSRPFADGNVLANLVTLEALHLFCLGTAALGAALFFWRHGNPFSGEE